MHPTAIRTVYASLTAAALGLVAIASVQSSAQPHGPVPPPVQLSKWIQATPNRALPSCSTSDPGTPEAPFFGFNGGSFQSCLIDGPYPWNNEQWFVMRIKAFAPPSPPAPPGPSFDLIRVCSKQAVHPDPATFTPGPCHTAMGVGPLGCEVCVKGGVPL